mgnify:CR=1 FL=1
MKIVDRKTFLKLPQGTFFAKGEMWSIDGFCVKGESYKNDFRYQNLVDFEWVSDEDHAETCDRMLETGESRPINKSEMRDGCFSDDDYFLVFEKEDLKYIKELIDQHA